MTVGVHLMGLAVALAAPTAAPVQPANRHVVQWIAPDGCPTAPQVHGWLTAVLGDREVGAVLEVSQPTPERWSVEVVLTHPPMPSARTIRGETCEAVARAAVVAIALATGGPRDDTSPRAVFESGPAPPEPSDRPAARRPRGNVDTVPPPGHAIGAAAAQLGIAGRVGYGPLPGAAGGIAGSIGVRGRRWWAEAGATHWFRAFVPVARGSTAGADIALTTATAKAGGLLRWRSVELPLGGGLQLGATGARSRGTTRSGIVRDPWVALSLGTGLHWRPTHWVTLGLEIDGVVPLIRQRFVIEGRTVHRVRPLAVEGGVTARFVLPGRNVSSARRHKTLARRQSP